MVRILRLHTKEFIQESVKLAVSYANINQAAKELGIPSPTLYEWVNKAKSSGNYLMGQDDGVLNSVDIGKLLDENKLLKMRLNNLEPEKEILKKAAATYRSGLIYIGNFC